MNAAEKMPSCATCGPRAERCPHTSFRDLDAPRSNIVAALVGMREAAALARKFEPERSQCPGASAEVICQGGWHAEAATGASRGKCRWEHYKAEAARLVVELARCGVSFARQGWKLHEALVERIDLHRPGVSVELRAARDHVAAWAGFGKAGASERGNVAFVGDTGTAKTMLMLALYFADLLTGMHVLWVPQSALRAVALDLRSPDLVVRGAAKSRLATWQRADVVYLEDLADRAPDSVRADGVLLDMLNQMTGRLVIGTNLSSGELQQHADVGPRAVSRLFADWVDVQAIKKGLDAEPVAATIFNLRSKADQRQHKLMQMSGRAS